MIDWTEYTTRKRDLCKIFCVHRIVQRAYRQWWRYVVLLCVSTVIIAILSACGATPRTQSAARATAEVTHCWPYTAPPQPATPTPLPLRGGTFDPTYPPQTPVVAYPPCPIPEGQPTYTPTTVPAATPFVPGAVSGPLDVGVKQGKNTNYAMAVHPADGRVVLGWVSWGNSVNDDLQDSGQVWVRAQVAGAMALDQVASDNWQPAMTINPKTAPVNRLVGGLGLTFALSDTVVAAWGDGRTTIYTATSHDAGATWDFPMVLGTFAYQVVDLQVDLYGGLHLLTLTPHPHSLRYSYRPPQGDWQPARAFDARNKHLKGALAVLTFPDGTVRRFVVSTVVGDIRLAWSDDGVIWQPVSVPTGTFMHERQPDFPAILAASRDAGDVVVVSWSQYSAGGLFAMVSTNGGATWGPQEQVVQYLPDGSCPRNEGVSCGFHPSLGYSPATDRLALVWQNVMKGREPQVYRTRLSWRSLAVADAVTPWRYHITPATSELDDSPVLGMWLTDGNDAGWGKRGQLFGSTNHDHHALLFFDENNQQNKMIVQLVDLPVWLAEDMS